MPFQSEKQRRYMHANLPDIAKRWERDYAGGGRIDYNKGSPLIIWGKPVDEQWDNLNEDQKKYIRENFPDQVPKEAAQGGLIPAHEAGIYGLEEGGRIGFFTGAQADTASGKSMSPGTSASGGTRNGGPGPDRHPPAPTAPPQLGGPSTVEDAIKFRDTPPEVTTGDGTTPQVEGYISFNQATGKRMTARDRLIAQRFKDLVDNKGYYDSDTATDEETELYNAYLEATGLGANPPMKISSADVEYINSINGKTTARFKSNTLSENLLTGNIIRETRLGSGLGEDIKSTSRIVTPWGIQQDGVFTSGLRAPQSWAVNPGKTGTISHENFINFVPNVNTWEGQEGGIAGLKQGGQLVKPGPGRQGYNGWESDFSSDWGGEAAPQGSPPGSDPGPGRQETTVTDYEGEAYGTPDTIAELTSTRDDGPQRNVHFDTPEILEEQRKLDLQQMVRNQSEKTEKWEQAQQWNKPNKFVSFIKNVALAIIPGLLPAKMATAWKVGKLGFDYKAGKLDHYLPADFKSTGKYVKDIGNTIQQNAEKRKTRNAELDLYESFADTPNHPERIALQAELEIGKKPPTDVQERDGATQETNIKIENIEEVNDAKTQLLRKYQEMNEASRLAWLRQQEMEKAKRMSYYRMMMKPYFTGAAQGGRVPQGYNTGGLSNLFKLKNV